jgi:drug/metabolite transporter (DMT)-like permease
LPFISAALAWLLMRERGNWREMVASVTALGGVAVMAGGAIGAGHLLGDLLALAMTVLFALSMVLIRRGREVSMLPAVALSCFLTSAVAWHFAKTGPIAELPMLRLVLFGALQLGLGFILLTIGMRLVSTAKAALIGLLDAPLAPLWVWLAFNEVPPYLTLVGGAIVLAAVTWSIAATRPA